jgi:hypothetical protein
VGRARRRVSQYDTPRLQAIRAQEAKKSSDVLSNWKSERAKSGRL